MNPNPTSTGSELSRSRAERSNKLSLRAFVGNLILGARLRLGKLVSFPLARVLMVFVVGFAAGMMAELPQSIAAVRPKNGGRPWPSR